MKTIKSVRWISMAIARPPEVVYDFASDARNLPLWAAGLATGIEPDGELWRLGPGDAAARLLWASPNVYGVLDHTVFLSDGTEVFVPLRVVPNGAGCELVFGLYREPSMDDQTFERDAGLVEADLRALKTIVEQSAQQEANGESAAALLGTSREVLQLLARYNSTVNQTMNQTIAPLNDEEWTRPMGGTYPTVKSLCAHLYVSDRNWMQRLGKLRIFRTLDCERYRIEHEWSEVLIDSVADYLEKRAQLDRDLSALIAEFTHDDLARRLSYINWRGEAHNRVVAGLWLHVFNHQTHHRGMISVALEQLGYDNDFSTLVPFV